MSDNMPRREWGILEEKLARIIALCKEAKDEIERLREDFDTLTATCRNYAAENAKLREALKRVIGDIHDYENINNLSPSPGRKYCWDSVAHAHEVLDHRALTEGKP